MNGCVARYSESSCILYTLRFLRSVRLAIHPLATIYGVMGKNTLKNANSAQTTLK